MEGRSKRGGEAVEVSLCFVGCMYTCVVNSIYIYIYIYIYVCVCVYVFLVACVCVCVQMSVWRNK